MTQYEVREDLFERTACECGSKLIHGVVCDNAALVEHDDARAEALDDVEDVRRIQNRRQDSQQDGAA